MQKKNKLNLLCCACLLLTSLVLGKPTCKFPFQAPFIKISSNQKSIFADNKYNQLYEGRMLDRFLLLPEYKLAFCYIEKVGCTQFNRLFHALLNCNTPKFWFSTSAGRAYHLTKKDMNDILLDNDWHKGIFYRDPIERFVSGFQSKCLPGHDGNGAKECIKDFGHSGRPTFAEVIEKIHKMNATTNMELNNVHFVRMIRSCGGLDSTLQYFNTIEILERKTANHKIKRMFEKATKKKLTNVLIKQIDKFFPVDPKALNSNSHNTNAYKTTQKLLEQNASYEKILFKHFSSDYALFDLPRKYEKKNKI